MNIDERDIREYFLLQNYLTNGLNARGILLKMSFDTLRQINNDEWIHSFPAESKPTVRCFIQMDIISKIMMYLEDLAIFCESFSKNISFYDLLIDDKIDLGKLVGNFYANIGKKNLVDIFKMKCYLPLEQIHFEDDEISDQIKIHMKSNAIEFQKSINTFRSFGFTNHSLFKRYKHGGMTIICDAPLNRNEDFLTKFETYSAVVLGNDPLKDLILIPFSEEIIESYHILIHGLQKIITEVVSNRINCIRRQTSGTIPLLRYDVSLPIEKTTVEKGIAIFDNAHPIIPIISNLELNVNLKNESIEYYNNLDAFLEECKHRKEVADEFNKKGESN